jgi:hypothetical protein
MRDGMPQKWSRFGQMQNESKLLWSFLNFLFRVSFHSNMSTESIAVNGSGLESNPQGESQVDTQPEEAPQPQSEPQELDQPQETAGAVDSQATTVVDDVAPETAPEAGEPPTSPILKKRKFPHTLVDPRILNSPMTRSVRQRVVAPTAIYEPSSPTYSPTSPLKNYVPPLRGESEDELEDTEVPQPVSPNVTL